MGGIIGGIAGVIGDRLQESHDKHLEQQSQQKKAEFDTLWEGLKKSASRIEELKAKGDKATPEETKEAERLIAQYKWSTDALGKLTKSNKQASGAMQKFGQVVGKVLGRKQSKQSFDQGPQQAQQTPAQGGQPPAQQQPTVDQQQGSQGPASKPPGMSVTDQQPAQAAPAAQAKQAFNDGPSMQGAMAAADTTNIDAARARDSQTFKTNEQIRLDSAKSKNKIAEDAAKPAKTPAAQKTREQLEDDYAAQYENDGMSKDDAKQHAKDTAAKLNTKKAERSASAPVSAAAQSRKQLVDDYTAANERSGMPKEEAAKAAEETVAGLETKKAEKLATAPQTEEDKLARYFTDAGLAGTPAEAKRKAASNLVSLQGAKVKAAQGGSSVTFNAQELGALADWAIATGQNPNFGLSANNPNRIAYQKAFAEKVSGGDNMSNALSTRTDVKALQGTLSDMEKRNSQIGSFEGGAHDNIKNALDLSEKVGRTGASLANEYILNAQGKLEDYPELAAFKVAVETAANEYAKVVNSATGGGVSTDSARAEAHSFFNSAMPKGSLKSAGEQMFTEMGNRTRNLRTTIDGIKEQIAQAGKPASSTKLTSPPSGSKKVKVWNEKDQKFE